MASGKTLLGYTTRCIGLGLFLRLTFCLVYRVLALNLSFLSKDGWFMSKFTSKGSALKPSWEMRLLRCTCGLDLLVWRKECFVTCHTVTE